MLTTTNKITTCAVMVMIALTTMIGGCKKDTPAARSTTYTLKTKDQLGVSGTVKFTETSSTVTTVTITLTGSDATSHPAHIHLNSAVEGGGVAISLNDVVNGTSTTSVTALDNTTPITYSGLIAFDGYVNVHESANALGTIIAQGDIGGNALTGASKTYALDTVGTYGVSGTALFEKRNNGNSLVTVTLQNTLSTGTYPAGIYLGSVTTVGGGLLKATLNSVDGASGKSYTTVRTLDASAGSTAVTYDQWLVYDGYIAILQSPTISTVICQGNIGTH